LSVIKELSCENATLSYRTEDDEFNLELDPDSVIFGITYGITIPNFEETTKEIENMTVNKDKSDVLLSNSQILRRMK
jgi:hypothetical protein